MTDLRNTSSSPQRGRVLFGITGDKLQEGQVDEEDPRLCVQVTQPPTYARFVVERKVELGVLGGYVILVVRTPNTTLASTS